MKALDCKGSTNTLAALRVALADPNTEAIYLLTDGRPDQVRVTSHILLSFRYFVKTSSRNFDIK